jgi:hypothetical protein
MWASIDFFRENALPSVFNAEIKNSVRVWVVGEFFDETPRRFDRQRFSHRLSVSREVPSRIRANDCAENGDGGLRGY